MDAGISFAAAGSRPHGRKTRGVFARACCSILRCAFMKAGAVGCETRST
jgi:hypothetical protein